MTDPIARAMKIYDEAAGTEDFVRLAEAEALLAPLAPTPEIRRARAHVGWMLARYTRDRATMESAARALAGEAPELARALTIDLAQADLDAEDVLTAKRRLAGLEMPKGWRLSIARRAAQDWRADASRAVRSERNGTLFAGGRDWFIQRADGTLAINGLVNANPAAGQYVLCTVQNGLTAIAAPRPTIDLGKKPHVLIGGNGNYYHWLFDFLPRLGLVLARPDLAGQPLIVGQPPASFETATLAHLGIGPERLRAIPQGTAASFTRLAVPDLGTVDAVPHAETIAWLKATFVAKPGRTGRRLWLTRKEASTRRVVNEDEVLAALAPLGIEPFEAASLSVSEQAQAFAEAELVVGPHGAAFANLVFCRPGTRVIEIMPGRHKQLGYFPQIARACGLAHQRLHAHPVRPANPEADGRQQNWHMAVDVGELLGLTSRPG